MQLFALSQLLSDAPEHPEEARYVEFLRQPALSMGVYSLTVGAIDPQQPHTEDEVYYVVSGQGSFRVGNEDHQVKAGTIIFVEANALHRFYNIIEDLTALVFFAPAEHTPAAETEKNPTPAS